MAKEAPFVVCKASAGSGKTFTLVKEYLKLAFAGGEATVGNRFRSILAITFTNKATAEMKDRIMRELESLATAPVDKTDRGMGGTLMRELGISDDEQMQRMAGMLHSAILHHYSDLSVCTIDSFMHRVVRTFAHDLGQAMNFDVQTEQDELVEEAVSRLMAMAGTEGHDDLTAVLLAFADNRMEDDKGYDIEGQLRTLAGLLFREDADHFMKRLSKLSLDDFRKVQRTYKAEMHRYEDEVKAVGESMMGKLHAAGLTIETAAYGKSGYYTYFAKVAAGEIAEPTPRAVAAMEEGKLVAAKSDSRLKAAAEQAWPGLREEFVKLKALLGDGMVRYNTQKALLRNIYSLAVLGEIAKQMQLYADDNEVVHLSRFNKLINQVVEEDDNPAPFFYERLGNRYRHFLIDEFQDTSVMQWHNLVPLVENGVSQRHESLVVGDGKQAIYRFRQGDVRQFVRLPHVDGMVHHGGTLPIEGNYRQQSLDTNYRTARAIVEFNNRLFSWLAQGAYADNPVVQEIYVGTEAGEPRCAGDEELRQKVSKSEQGYVGLQFVSKADVGDDVRGAIYERVLQTIETLVTERGYSYGDIMVLARSNAEIAAIGNYLTLHGDVPQTSTESFYLRESNAVMAIVTVLRLLHDRDDRVAAAELLNRLAALGMIDDEQMHLAIEQIGRAELPDSVPHLKLNIDYLGAMDLYGCCEEIVRQLGIDGIDLAYVGALLNRVASFAARHKQDVGEFLEWFDAHPTLSASAADGLDAVRLLTIHKSKGLEAPVVICPLLFGKEHPLEMWVESDEELLPAAYVTLNSNEHTEFDEQCRDERWMMEVDDLNVLYVALTRPREQLYVFCPDPADIKKPKEHDLRYPTLLKAFADSEGYDEGDANMHRAGRERVDGKQTIGMQSLSFADWTERVRVASPSETTLTRLREEKVRLGIRIHDLMASIEYADDVDDAVAQMTATDSSDYAADKERLSAIAHAVVTHKQARRFFERGCVVRNECDLVWNGRHLRPDRVVTAGDETWVVDFKTGVPMAEHRQQVSDYCHAMRDMGHANVKGYILYMQPDISVVDVEA